VRLITKEDDFFGGYSQGEVFDSREFYITEDGMNYYIHGIIYDTGYSSSNYMPIPKYAVRVEDEND
jgi:hypothetical protein